MLQVSGCGASSASAQTAIALQRREQSLKTQLATSCLMDRRYGQAAWLCWYGSCVAEARTFELLCGKLDDEQVAWGTNSSFATCVKNIVGPSTSGPASRTLGKIIYGQPTDSKARRPKGTAQLTRGSEFEPSSTAPDQQCTHQNLGKTKHVRFSHAYDVRTYAYLYIYIYIYIHRHTYT